MAGARGAENSGAGSPRPRNLSISAGSQPRRSELRRASTAWMAADGKADASTVVIGEPRGGGEPYRNADWGRHCDSAGAGGAPALLRSDGMRRLKDRETFPFPRFMKATSVVMCTAADGCGGGREPWTRRNVSSFRFWTRHESAEVAGSSPARWRMVVVEARGPTLPDPRPIGGAAAARVRHAVSFSSLPHPRHACGRLGSPVRCDTWARRRGQRQ